MWPGARQAQLRALQQPTRLHMPERVQIKERDAAITHHAWGCGVEHTWHVAETCNVQVSAKCMCAGALHGAVPQRALREAGDAVIGQQVVEQEG